MLQHADHTLTKLRQLIASGGLGAGGRIPPERTLANEMGVGRRSLRRALEILEQEGQITRHQGRGTFVQDKSAPVAAPTVLRARDGDLAVASAMSAIPFDRILEFTNPLEVIEVRLAVEPVIARLAALRASQSDIRRLQTAGRRDPGSDRSRRLREGRREVPPRGRRGGAQRAVPVAVRHPQRQPARRHLAAAQRERPLLQAPVGAQRLAPGDLRGDRRAQQRARLRVHVPPFERRAAPRLHLRLPGGAEERGGVIAGL